MSRTNGRGFQNTSSPKFTVPVESVAGLCGICPHPQGVGQVGLLVELRENSGQVVGAVILEQIRRGAGGESLAELDAPGRF